MWLALIIGGLILLAVRGTIGVDFVGCLFLVIAIMIVYALFQVLIIDNL